MMTYTIKATGDENIVQKIKIQSTGGLPVTRVPDPYKKMRDLFLVAYKFLVTTIVQEKCFDED